MSQNLQLELRTVRATLGTQVVDAVQAVVSPPRTDHLKLEFHLELLHVIS